jgi:hypothetical protein
MAKAIVSEYDSEVVLSSHRGLSSVEIMEDCLEKAKAMLEILSIIEEMTSLSSASHRQYLRLLDDMVGLSRRHLMKLRNLSLH